MPLGCYVDCPLCATWLLDCPLCAPWLLDCPLCAPWLLDCPLCAPWLLDCPLCAPWLLDCPLCAPWLCDDELLLILFIIGSLSLRPPYGNMLGGTSVVVSGPCFEESYEITCYFGTAEVQGVYLNIRLAICVSPMLQVAGDVRFRLQMLEKGQFIYESNSIPFYSRKHKFIIL